jgi:hypothetical protein
MVVPRTRLATYLVGPNGFLAGSVDESIHVIGARVHGVEMQAAHLLFNLEDLKRMALRARGRF